MSAPPRPSSSVRHLSQAGVNISPPAVLPQYPPSSYPPRTPSVPQAPSASEVRHAPSSVMNGHGAPPPDTHRHFRGPNRGDDEPPQPSGSQAPPTPAPTGEMKVQKKRARRPSTSQMPPQSPSSPKLDGGLPSVLVREKKQKACANCRRAKLKCIVETDGTDCVRCKARKERCIFYPRSHDEDWQQTLTTDVYSGINHLAHLSAAVHHMLHHLTGLQVIPPYEAGLGSFDAPDRDMTVLSGWAADKSRESPGEDTKRRGKRKTREQMEEDDDTDDDQGIIEPHRASSQTFAFPQPMIRPHSLSISDRAWPPPNSMPIPPSPSIHQYSGPHLPPFRPPQHARPAQPTPTSELNMPVPQPHYSPVIMMPPPQLSPMNTTIPNPNGNNTPASIQNTTPSSLLHSSPAIDTDANGFPVIPPPPTVENGIVELDEGSELLGSDDGRTSIIRKRLVSPADARTLVDHFHSHLSPFLFGYRLQFRHFPYLPDGPKTMTPFILAVLCLASSERLPGYTHLRAKLETEVLDMIESSPAESWLTFASAKAVAIEPPAVKMGEDALDPELGIGPEEIVGASILATFWSGSPGQCIHIARCAFRWARGWIKLLKGPDRSTFAEAAGMVPPERRANEDDMARVWLLCYIVDASYAIQWDSTSAPPPGRDPLRWCQVLVPFTQGHETTTPSANDVLLTLHARLIKILHDWLTRRQYFPPLSAFEQKRLATSTNALLDLWQSELDGHALDRWYTREIVLFWLYAKMSVNAFAVKELADPRDKMVRDASRAMNAEAAYTLLDSCAQWSPREELVNLPNCYFSMISLAGVEVTNAIQETAVHGIGNTGCNLTPGEVLPLLRDIRDTLYSCMMDHRPISAMTAGALKINCDELEHLYQSQ